MQEPLQKPAFSKQALLHCAGIVGAGLLYSLGINLFVVPTGLYTGGIMGFAQLLRTLFLHLTGLELKIDTSPSGLDAVTALLEQQGITGVIIDDEADFKDFLEHNRQYWDYVDEDLLREKAGVSRVTFYLERNEDALNIVAQVRIAMSALKKEHPEYGPMLLTIDNVADADWENNWKKFYKPMEIGERLLVVPQWEETKARGRMKLVLNPGLTFGTGSHATTRLCLQSLDKYIHGGGRVLDLGCGSGILSIAALRLGAEYAFACDIDEKCVDVAYENAALNGIGKDRYTVRWGDVLTDKALQAELPEERSLQDQDLSQMQF